MSPYDGTTPTFFERARKFLVAIIGVAVLYGTIVTDTLGEADFSTVEGIIGGVIALATALGVYAAKNKPA
jgi:hypothetical protein